LFPDDARLVIEYWAHLITRRPLSVGCLIYERMDQIDFTGPFEVLSRTPDTTVHLEFTFSEGTLVAIGDIFSCRGIGNESQADSRELRTLDCHDIEETKDQLLKLRAAVVQDLTSAPSGRMDGGNQCRSKNLILNALALDSAAHGSLPHLETAF
jgi:hypothetical protein